MHPSLLLVCGSVLAQVFPVVIIFLPSFSTVVSPTTVASASLDTPITDQDITTIARDYLVKWEELSPHLELTAPQEHSIRQTFKDYEDQKREALRMWKRNKGNRATYRTFITAAETISNVQLADNVRALPKERLQHTSLGLLVLGWSLAS